MKNLGIISVPPEIATADLSDKSHKLVEPLA